MTFLNAVTTAYAKSFVITGRARRSEFWFFQLFVLLVMFPLAAIGEWWGIGEALVDIFLLVSLPASITVAARRLHDTDRSGWWQLLPIVNLVFWCFDSDDGANRFGPSDKYPVPEDSATPHSATPHSATPSPYDDQRAVQP